MQTFNNMKITPNPCAGVYKLTTAGEDKYLIMPIQVSLE